MATRDSVDGAFLSAKLAAVEGMRSALVKEGAIAALLDAHASPAACVSACARLLVPQPRPAISSLTDYQLERLWSVAQAS